MSANSGQQRRAPPLAGRPPFATDEDEVVYDDPPAARPRRQQDKPPQNGRDSMYSAWDNYLQHDKDDRPVSGGGGIGGLMTGDFDDSDEDEPTPQRGYAAPAKSSNLRTAPAMAGPGQNGNIARPAPAMAVPPNTRQASFDRPQYQQQPPMANPVPRQANGVQRPAAAALRVDVPQPAMPIPRAPIPAFMPSPSPSPSPSLNPHPLNAPSTPITPVFARPSFQDDRKVEFAATAIMRGNSEETLIPRNTQKGDEFWRRFSYFAKEDPKEKTSSWLKKTRGNNRSMSRWVWCISIFLLLCIGGAIGVGWYFTHNKAATMPVAVGGSADESQLSTASTPASTANAENTSRTLIAPTIAGTKRSEPEYGYITKRDNGSIAQPTPRAHLYARHRRNRLPIDALD